MSAERMGYHGPSVFEGKSQIDRNARPAWFTENIESIPEAGRQLLERYSGIAPERVLPHVISIVRNIQSIIAIVSFLLTTLFPARQSLRHLVLCMHRPSPISRFHFAKTSLLVRGPTASSFRRNLSWRRLLLWPRDPLPSLQGRHTCNTATWLRLRVSFHWYGPRTILRSG